ncbi:D-3-phosphoglycerate dehydrogenase/C-terminal binding protein [Rhizobiales bacterium GAS191]|nr:D-3-phosphoglycerate dehydrogenase/C-terminal binding protein [Rhizobiales bacterium GAS113]SED68233.1 D-3-phosphoglycerate dehydrogenase/C-terminal binding protein [Rhizobiales bacterium GAS191]SEE73648.1 D-3-phosphoglycerate dehydrogenase/C-terminal binding protein [Rhizobiales bacterium GAS188]
MIRILCANWNHADDAELERKHFPDVSFDLCKSPMGSSSPIPADLGQAADAVINYSGVSHLTEKPSFFPRARIAVRHGVGFDNIDTAGFGALGVPVCNVPDYGTTEVADHAVALMLSLARGTIGYHEALRADPRGGWRPRAAPLVLRLRTATFGVVGLGRIGIAAAQRAKAFGMRIVFYDPYKPSGTELALGYTRLNSLEELMSQSDVVSVHTPLTAETHHLIGTKALAAAKPGLILVNTARGGVVDLDALHDAMCQGKVGGAALDVLETEPADPTHPLIKAFVAREPWLEGRFTLSPHAAFFSPAAQFDLRYKTAEVAVTYLKEGRLMNCVNEALLKTPLR